MKKTNIKRRPIVLSIVFAVLVFIIGVGVFTLYYYLYDMHISMRIMYGAIFIFSVIMGFLFYFDEKDYIKKHEKNTDTLGE